MNLKRLASSYPVVIFIAELIEYAIQSLDFFVNEDNLAMFNYLI